MDDNQNQNQNPVEQQNPAPTAPEQAPVQESVATPIPEQTPPAPPPPAENQPVQTNQAPKKSIYVGILIVILLLVAAGTAFVVITLNNKPVTPVPQQEIPAVQTPTPAPSPTPTVTPVTKNTIDQTLLNTDKSLQQAVDQANTDLKDYDAIDKTQDTTTGL